MALSDIQPESSWGKAKSPLLPTVDIMQFIRDKQSSFLFYTGNDGKVNVEVFLKDETVWLTQKAIGRLFGKSKATISEHLRKIYADGELQMDSTVRKFRTVQTEGNRQVKREMGSPIINFRYEGDYRGYKQH